MVKGQASNASLIHLLHRASQIAEERLINALSDNALTPRQLAVLAAVANHEGSRQTDIVVASGIDRSTLADIVRRLVKRGLVTRRRTKEDARAYAVRVTEAGQRILASCLPVQAQVEAELLEILPARKRSELFEMLSEISLPRGPRAAPD